MTIMLYLIQDSLGKYRFVIFDKRKFSVNSKSFPHILFRLKNIRISKCYLLFFLLVQT